MAIGFRDLLPQGQQYSSVPDRWHSGSGIITYSFLSTVPDYYDTTDFNNDGIDEHILLGGSPRQYVNEGVPVALNSQLRQLAAEAVTAWNDVANVHLVPGSAEEGAEPGSPVTGDGHLVGSLGGPAGFGETVVPRNDDGFTAYDLTSVFGAAGLKFAGGQYTQMFINTNGSITFGDGTGQYTPSAIAAGAIPMLAAFWADVDTRTNGAPDSGPIYVDFDAVKDIITITWKNVGYYNVKADKTNSFQIQLYDRGNGNFDAVFRYEDIQWTAGDSSGGSGGTGGTPATAGWTAGNQADFLELAQSGNEAAMLALESTVGNTGVTGLWEFEFRDGQFGVGDITFGQGQFGSRLFGFVSDRAPEQGGNYYFTGTLNDPSADGDVWLNMANSFVAGARLGDEGYDTILHELGHALGLRHPGGNGENPATNSQFSVMSYNPHPSFPDGGSQVGTPWPITPMVLDIQAIQSLYGANYSTRNTDTTYFGTPVSGSTGAYRMDGDGTLPGNSNLMIMAIWDGGGNDTIVCSHVNSVVDIDLREGQYSTIGAGIVDNIGIAYGAVIENATGGYRNDKILGNFATNFLLGQGGNDTLNGGAGIDTTNGGAGDDTHIVDNHSDTVSEAVGRGADRVLASVTYALSAGQEIETLATQNSAMSSAINFTGNEFAQKLLGNAGANSLNGKAGTDTLAGFGGSDSFRFNTALGASNIDSITDFNVADDTIRLDNAVFVGLARGMLPAGAFYAGAAAHDADDRVIYKANNGALLFDEDGLGGVAAQRFATVSTGLLITHADFVVVV